MVRRSIISSAAGMIPAATMAEVARLASSMVSKLARRVRTPSWTRIRRTVTSVTTANVPSEPTTSPVRS